MGGKLRHRVSPPIPIIEPINLPMATQATTYCSDDIRPAHNFFRPRVIMKEYEKGWNGKRTLILGPHQWCAERGANERCQHKCLCCSCNGIWEMDDCCPEYAPRGHKLSDGNRAEIDIFFNPPGNALYADHTFFTRLMLGLDHKPTQEERVEFWNKVAFHNLLQLYVPEKREFPYSADKSESEYLQQYATYKDMYADAHAAFVSILQTLAPEVIYVWGDATCQALKSYEIEGLTCEGQLVKGDDPIELPNAGMKIYVFSYCTEFSKDLLPKALQKDFRVENPYLYFSPDVADKLRFYIEQLNKKGKELKPMYYVITFIILDWMGRIHEVSDKRYWELLRKTTSYQSTFESFRSAKSNWEKPEHIVENKTKERILSAPYRDTLDMLGIHKEDFVRECDNILEEKWKILLEDRKPKNLT